VTPTEKPSELVSWAKVVAAVIFGAGVFYAGVMGLPTKMHELEKIVTEHDKKLAVFENDIGYIKRGIDTLIEDSNRSRRRKEIP
jgi:acyl CoA:acetate/3-ketoacid CoA transferase alpha subunit